MPSKWAKSVIMPLFFNNGVIALSDEYALLSKAVKISSVNEKNRILSSPLKVLRSCKILFFNLDSIKERYSYLSGNNQSLDYLFLTNTEFDKKLYKNKINKLISTINIKIDNKETKEIVQEIINNKEFKDIL